VPEVAQDRGMEHQMGDRGKKDKDKSRKQKQQKHEQDAKKKAERVPAKVPASS
jgi:hypothetical protein